MGRKSVLAWWHFKHCWDEQDGALDVEEHQHQLQRHLFRDRVVSAQVRARGLVQRVHSIYGSESRGQFENGEIHVRFVEVHLSKQNQREIQPLATSLKIGT